MADHDDRRLVAEARAGSRAAGEKLFSRHWLGAWRLALSVTGSPTAADDVAQDAFERAFRALPTFNGRSSFRTWLFRIVVNRAVDVARRQETQEPFEPDDVAALGWSEEDAVRDDALLEAVLSLPLDRRTVVALRYWAGYTPPEIAGSLDLPLGTVHSRLARALEELRSRLEETNVR
ncbi:MAG TPA: sigma-70 family RNA polymerase sigma factor [Gaiellaceae bacterium]|nr:sigma-70 family RNA polymerase sigma factor [Gaiellaceae bacterium]